MKKKTLTWFELAKGDLEFAESIVDSAKRPQYAVHFCHQAIEKILKAIIQEHTNSIPQKTHNFKILIEQGGIDLPDNLEANIAKLSPHYLASKYPEDLEKLHKVYTVAYASTILEITKELFLWLENYLISKK
ncbi:MAG: HEPN domain-containing protein [Pseudomonadota bacterium]